MGCEVKRVPLDFSWPMNEVWFGYVLDRVPCQLCNGKVKNCELCYGAGEAHPTIEVPSGEAWQMWETVSEGSPISPALGSPEELARWLAENGADACGGDTATYEQWLATVNVGGAYSMVFDPGRGLRSGVAFNAEVAGPVSE